MKDPHLSNCPTCGFGDCGCSFVTRCSHLHSRGHNNPVDSHQLAEEVVKVGSQLLIMLATPIPTEDTAGLMFYAAVKYETQKRVAELVIKAKQLQAENQKADAGTSARTQENHQ